MYGLDVNFLNDRAQRQTEAGLKSTAVKDDPRPYYIGGGVALALLAAVGGAWFLLNGQNAELEKRQAELDGQLVALQAQLGEVQNVSQQVSQIESENQALATVFDQIKPWSAVLQDVRDRVPNGIQLDKIEQLAPTVDPAAAAAPAPSPSPSASPEASPAAGAPATVPVETVPTSQPRISLSGKARSFNDVNDFLLTLQQSPFLKGEDLKIVQSELIDNPTQVEFTGQSASGEITVELPKVVEYTIEGDFSDMTASELLQDLERTLSVGLAARIQALRDRGVLKP
ncbi:MAG: PilN domain-containing protein [Drouetiella hepatica Uher 2000/2452]|jgi:type IV pilus assembly protein PilN|uniref:PilN domain-containing protein n=1 Tax=Drouetiella hepatica Uher 2000/2452 TaxID=904376 RepID=A0A951QD60_9CYAN|nr:PilN domain-containing protein [Drouetiella hepatica Uher 2000/2452]